MKLLPWEIICVVGISKKGSLVRSFWAVAFWCRFWVLHSPLHLIWGFVWIAGFVGFFSGDLILVRLWVYTLVLEGP